MNIAIDTTPLMTGHAGRGVGVYTRCLIDALQKHEHKHSYSFFTRGQKIPKNVEIVHYPYFDPFFLTLPFQKTVPSVVTVHDLIPFVFPNHFAPGIRGILKWQIQKAALKRVDRILTVSQCSKNDVEKFVGIDESKIDVVYSAPEVGYHQVADKKLLLGIQKKHGLPDTYFIYVGDVNWNKNILGMINAFSKLSATRSDCALVLVGKSFLDESLTETQEIHNLIKKLGVGNQVIMPGYVSTEDLNGMYALACSSLELSFYEGFGLPVLESMMSGCPAIVADNSSLREIGGPSIRVDANDITSIVMGMEKMILLSSDERRKHIAEGTNWAKKFSWKKTARETIAVYEKVLG